MKFSKVLCHVLLSILADCIKSMNGLAASLDFDHLVENSRRDMYAAVGSCCFKCLDRIQVAFMQGETDFISAAKTKDLLWAMPLFTELYLTQSP